MRRLVWAAAAMVVVFGGLEALGMVEELGVLTMMPPAGQTIGGAIVLAGVFLASWFAAVVVAPILLLAAGVDWLIR